MKNLRRSLTVAIILAVASCALIIALRSFAQPGPYDVNIPNWQKLKPPYDEANDPDGDRWEKDILRHHSTKYCVIHLKKDGTEKYHPAGCHVSTFQPDTSKSELIPVANKSTPTPSLIPRPTGANVTQQISCASQRDNDAIVATFDNSP